MEVPTAKRHDYVVAGDVDDALQKSPCYPLYALVVECRVSRSGTVYIINGRGGGVEEEEIFFMHYICNIQRLSFEFLLLVVAEVVVLLFLLFAYIALNCYMIFF